MTLPVIVLTVPIESVAATAVPDRKMSNKKIMRVLLYMSYPFFRQKVNKAGNEIGKPLKIKNNRKENIYN